MSKVGFVDVQSLLDAAVLEAGGERKLNKAPPGAQAREVSKQIARRGKGKKGGKK